MPTSHHMQLSAIVDAIVTLNPQSILDIGVGFGKYGMLAREYLDIADGEGSYRARKHRIDGIEAFPEYITPLHEFVYDEMFIGDASLVVPRLSRSYDLVLMIDVIEHLTKEDGVNLISRCLSISRNILVSTPREFIEQHDHFGNLHEVHRSHWKTSDFASMGPTYALPNADEISLVAFIGKDAEAVRHRLFGWRRRMKAAFPWIIKPYRALKRAVRRPGVAP